MERNLFVSGTVSPALRWCWGALPAAIALAAYVIVRPQAPDLAAQVARSGVAGVAGVTEWWVGWFGGLQLPSYSLLAPWMMSLVGTIVAGSAAVVVSVVALGDLLRGVRRPTLGLAAFGVMAVADVAAGRLTFALSFAVGTIALVALRRRSRWSVAVALVCALLSLLGALFLGVAAVAVALTDRSRRKQAGTVAVVLLGVAGVEQVLLPGTGTMPFSTGDLLGAAATAAGVAIVVPQRTIRVGAALMAVLPVAVMLDPGAIGENAVRLSWLVAAPLVVACADLPRRWLVAAAATAAAAWPVTNTAQQLWSAQDASAQPSFYRPLLTALATAQRAAGPQSLGERVEVVPTRTHWETTYLVNGVQLARGWDRQADVADNPLFYTGALTSAQYRQWLTQLAVGWVARPRAPLDGAGKAEAALVDAGQPYLRLVWQDANWSLYRVTPAAPLAVGAQTVQVTPTTVTLRFDSPGRANVQLRWSPYLVVQPVAGGGVACATAHNGFTEISSTAPGYYTITARFRPDPEACHLAG